MCLGKAKVRGQRRPLGVDQACSGVESSASSRSSVSLIHMGFTLGYKLQYRFMYFLRYRTKWHVTFLVPIVPFRFPTLPLLSGTRSRV
jgi:hypothetical protein